MLKIAIVGGGPASVSLCAQLYQKLKKLNANVRIEIIVFEKLENRLWLTVFK